MIRSRAWLARGASCTATRREEAPARKDPSYQVLKEPFRQRCDTSDPAERVGDLANHVVFKDLGGRVDGCQLEFLLGFEMGVKATLAHSDMVSELADGEPL